MKPKRTFLRSFFALATALTMLAGCSSPSDKTGWADGEIEAFTEADSTSGGVPTTISMQRLDHIDPPEGFESRYTFQEENPEQNEKFIFDAKPGESISVVNPSVDAISAEEVQSALTVRDAFGEVEDQNQNRAKTLLQVQKSNKRAFHLADPVSLRRLNSIAPNQKALILLDEPTEGGDLTIYGLDEYVPLNFEGKAANVDELIVATQRPDVEEFETNAEDMVGLRFDKVAELRDLNDKIEGEFLYNEPVNLDEGDQFFIGDHDTFDASATFFTFLSSTPQNGKYLIRYTVPDYSLCFRKFNIHAQTRPVNFDEPGTDIVLPSNEDLIRELNKEGGIIDIFEEEVVPQAALADPEVGPILRQALMPESLSVTINIDKLFVNASISFATEGSSVISSWNLTITYEVKSSAAGTILFRVGGSLYFKKTLSTYMDYSVKWTPWPKLSYVVCIRSDDETSFSAALGIAAAVKTDKEDDEDWEPDKQIEAIQGLISKAVPEGAQGGAGADASVEGVALPEITNPILHDVVGKDPGKDKYSYDGLKGFDMPKGKFVGDGVVVAGPGVVISLTYVMIELGISFYFTPNIQGKFYWAYNEVSTSVLCKVVNGFSEPEGFEDNVEQSRSHHATGIYGQVGFEVGFIFEMQVYPTGCKKIFLVSLSFTAGFYLTITGVLMFTFGSQDSFKFMGYGSIEIGFTFRINIRLIALNKAIIADLKTWSYKYALFCFGGNLHFLEFIDDRDELDWAGGRYININDFGILGVKWFNATTFQVGESNVKWDYETYFASAFVQIKQRLFDDLEILSGKEYVSFDDKKALFTVAENAPERFDFKFKIITNGWLGITMPNKTVTIHYVSNQTRMIGFEGYTGETGLIDGAYLGGGALKQGDLYRAPDMPPSSDGTPFYGWLGDNGLFLKPGETMSVGALNITFEPIYRPLSVYVVNFYDGHNNLISSQSVVDGGMAVEPTASIRDAHMGGAIFIGWDRDFDEVHSNINVYGIYAEGGKQ